MLCVMQYTEEYVTMGLVRTARIQHYAHVHELIVSNRKIAN